MKKQALAISLLVCLAVAQSLQAETVKGRIQSVSKKAGTLQIGVEDKKVVVRIDNNTLLEGFSSIDELNPPDLIEVEREPGQSATSDSGWATRPCARSVNPKNRNPARHDAC